MSDDDIIPVQKEESRQAFLRYLPKRIVAVEQRMQRYRREGWDNAGMAVLRGDLLRLGDASSHHGLLETCRHLLILARMVGEHVANNTSPDPQQAFRMFAQLTTVTGSLPASAEQENLPEPSEATLAPEPQPSAGGWQMEESPTPPVAAAGVPSAPPAMETVELDVPVGLAAPIEWELADASSQHEPVADAAPIEPAEDVELAAPIEWELVEPSVQIEPVADAAPIEPAELITQQAEAPSAAVALSVPEPIGPVEPVEQELAEPAVDADAVESAAPIEQSVPTQPIQPESVEPIASVASIETVVAPTPLETTESPQSVEASGQATMAAPVEPFDAVDTMDLDEADDDSEAGVRRVFYLNDGNPFAIELGKRLESEGYAVEPVESVEELSEMMMCLMPQLLLVDASHTTELDAIDRIRRDTQQRSETQRHIQLVALAEQDDLEGRRAAHRAEVDVLLFPPFDIADVVGRLHDLDAAAEEHRVRVLIVDDERTDAMFALTVLNKAGMRAHVEINPKRVLETIKALHPDLVLMDLHMPFVNGVELTMLIREDPVFARLPIVFLSGESDPDSRLEAINAGGDDFLFKPIRPRHLVAAVRERMRRMHPINNRGPGAGASGDPTGVQRQA